MAQFLMAAIAIALACLETEVPLATETFTGDHPLEIVLSANLHRRHLN